MKFLKSYAVEMPAEVDGKEIRVSLNVSTRMRRLLLAGGALNLVKMGSF